MKKTLDSLVCGKGAFDTRTFCAVFLFLLIGKPRYNLYKVFINQTVYGGLHGKCMRSDIAEKEGTGFDTS